MHIQSNQYDRNPDNLRCRIRVAVDPQMNCPDLASLRTDRLLIGVLGITAFAKENDKAYQEQSRQPISIV
jgi:hypothetical protein